MGSTLVDGVVITFLHRDAAWITSQEREQIKDLVAAEKESLRDRVNETLTHIEFISDDVTPLPRYNTVSDVVTNMEDVYDE